MNKEIEEYIVSYIFQRFELDNPVEYNSAERIIVIGKMRIIVPELQRNTQPVKLELFNVQVPYYRYDKELGFTKSKNEFFLRYDLVGEVYDHLTLVYEKEGILTPNSELVFYPLLDMKIYQFYQELQEILPTLKYKLFDGKDFVVGVSHDIDRTGDSFKYRLITYFFQTIKQKRPLLILKGIFGKNEETNFKYIVEKEKEYDANSTWFVLTRYGLKLNADYHLKDKEFKKAFNLLTSNNKEIGIHIPYMELEIDEIKKEFNKVKSNSKMGMRMHHLRGKYEELMKILDQSDITYDSTFGYNERMAYRFGTSIPFHPIIQDEILRNIYEIPLNIMDLQITDSLKYRKQIQKLFSILREVKGVCILNWHNNRFNKTKYGTIWIETFNTSLDETLKQNGLLTNIESILNLYKQKEIF